MPNMAMNVRWYMWLLPVQYLFVTQEQPVVAKKGFAVGYRQFMCGDFEAWTNISWWYDWKMNTTDLEKNCPELSQYRKIHIPMIWGHEALLNVNISDDAQYIIGFNEPNHPKQSNLTAWQAAIYWRELEAKSRGKLLVSPSATSCGGAGCHGTATEWFDAFFEHCSDCRVDYLATHNYECNAKSTMAYLEDLYWRYGRQIWLTEFACPHRSQPEKERKYMKEMIPLLEEASYIFRYSWYMMRIMKGTQFVTSAASLMKRKMSALTPLGTFYNSAGQTGNRSNELPPLRA